MKKIMVNAQVTSIISFLELSTTVLHTVIIKLNKGTSVYSLIYAMAVYDVILPYAFLMNTSHNKSRVVALGWNNVILNILGINNKLQKEGVVPNDDTSKHQKTLKKENKPKKDDKDKIYTIASHSNAEPTVDKNESEAKDETKVEQSPAKKPKLDENVSDNSNAKRKQETIVLNVGTMLHVPFE